MECQKRPVEKKSTLTPAYPPETCRPDNSYSSGSSFFHYSVIKARPINYECGSSPVRATVTFSTFSGLPIEMNLTMEDPDSHFEYAEKHS